MCSRTSGIPCQTFYPAVETLGPTRTPGYWTVDPTLLAALAWIVDLGDALGYWILFLDRRAVHMYDPTLILLPI